MPAPPGALLRLAALDVLTDPYVEAKNLIEELQGFGVMRFTLHAGKTITRGRPNEMRDGYALSFSQASELSYKPQRFNTTYQRASTPRQTMFYGSVLPEHLLLGELQAERIISVSESSTLLRNAHQPSVNSIPPPEVITFGRWVVTDDIPLVALCYYPPLLERNSLGRQLYAEFEQGSETYPEPLRSHTRAVNKFFAEQFAKPSHLFSSHQEYMFSALFAERVVEQGLAGVYFPSVKAEGLGFNVAISPDYADRCLRLDAVLEYHLHQNEKRFMLDNNAFTLVKAGQQQFALGPIPDVG